LANLIVEICLDSAETEHIEIERLQVISQEVIFVDCTDLIFGGTKNFSNFVKSIGMNSEKLKLKIFQKVDLLDNQKLEEIYGLISNHINREIDLSDWNKLAKEE